MKIRKLFTAVVTAGALMSAVPAYAQDIKLGVIAGMSGPGTSYGIGIRQGAEMAVKETNRIGALEQELTQLGVQVETRPDGLVVHGGAPKGATLKSHGDHRIAMGAAVAGLAAEGETTVRGWPAVAISYPGFAADLATLLEAS